MQDRDTAETPTADTETTTHITTTRTEAAAHTTRTAATAHLRHHHTAVEVDTAVARSEAIAADSAVAEEVEARSEEDGDNTRHGGGLWRERRNGDTAVTGTAAWTAHRDRTQHTL